MSTARRLIRCLYNGVQKPINKPSSKGFHTATSFDNLLVEQLKSVSLIRLNRPKSLNALNSTLMMELNAALTAINENKEIKVAVLTGDEKCFAAGADIQEMSKLSHSDCIQSNYLATWESMFRDFKKPLIAAVNGYALGGGCEVAMMCDIIYAGENAKFSQPEIKIGTIPGGGATQRLPRLIGKSMAMEMILTGQHISAAEALRLGLISKIFPPHETVKEAIETANKIASYSGPVINFCKQAIAASYELPLSQGLAYERNIFHQTFALADRTEGMKSFLEKRPPNFQNS